MSDAGNVHLGRRLTQEQQRRWVELLLACAAEIGVPDEPGGPYLPKP